jgi:glycine cleavage system aminomethyltransferase T
VADASSQTLKRTPLHDRHVAASARLVPFAGWEMPVQYAGIREEHVAVRTAAGVFDVSHMGQIETTGPQAAALLQRLVSNDIDALQVGASMYGVLCREDGGIVGERRLTGRAALVCGTGYTGEDGVEVLVAPEDAGAVWDEVVRRGAAPAGLGARDTLRLEACLPLYGNDLSEERGPIEAGLGWCCKEDTGFIGADAVRAVRDAGPSERLRPFKLTGPGIPRPGNPVAGGGIVTSGTLSPCLGIGVGMGYLPADRAEVGTEIGIDVRGKTREAVVAERPLYRKERDG